MAASVNIKQQKHRKNEMLINFRVMPLLEYAQIPIRLLIFSCIFLKRKATIKQTTIFLTHIPDFGNPPSLFRVYRYYYFRILWIVEITKECSDSAKYHCGAVELCM
jgi:hypothetical protein